MTLFTSLFIASVDDIDQPKYREEAAKMLIDSFNEENNYGSAIGNPDFGAVTQELSNDPSFISTILKDVTIITSNGPEGTMAVGLILFSISTDESTGKRILKIEGLYIKPECRGYGLAFNTVKAVEAVMCPDMVKLEVLPNNLPAIKLYKKLGFNTVMLEMVKQR